MGPDPRGSDKGTYQIAMCEFGFTRFTLAFISLPS